jgi:hypothetical protein
MEECPIATPSVEYPDRRLAATYLERRRGRYMEGLYSGSRYFSGSSWKSSRQPLLQNQ